MQSTELVRQVNLLEIKPGTVWVKDIVPTRQGARSVELKIIRGWYVIRQGILLSSSARFEFASVVFEDGSEEIVMLDRRGSRMVAAWGGNPDV
jgi:hypothetical protein